MSKPLLYVKNLSKTFVRQRVLDDVSFQVAEGQKIALIGRNGAGKSTLLKILTDEVSPDNGSVQFFDWTRMGVIKQNEVLPSEGSTLSYLEACSGKPEWSVKKMAAKFGLHEDALSKSPSQLSGGYQMRVKLIAMFLSDPNLLLLDEPVNYLDLQTLLLLERVLAEYRGGFILVAHDRTFLQNTCEVTYEIEREKLTIYKGKVQAYLEWKAQQLEFAKRTNVKLAKEIKHTQEFVDRFRYKASLASRAQNKLKHIGRLRGQIMQIDARLATTRIIIPSVRVHPGLALRLEGVTMGYSGKVIAQDVSLTINRGEKIVIAGENGKGKSTFLKTVVGALAPISGNVKWWKNADIGYYDQLTSASLRDHDTVLAHLMACAASNAPAQQILMMAGNFLFKGDDLDKTVSVLSGGERARLALAGLLLRSHNVLVLDEPTNHLDVETAEALALALKEYNGTVLFVSHARTFVQALADKVFEVRNGSVREYLGDYESYVEYLSDLADAEADCVQGSEETDETHRERRKQAHALIRQSQRTVSCLEQSMKKVDAEKSELLKFFFENPTDYAPDRAQRLSEVTQELDELERQWLKEQENIEQLRKADF